MIFHINRETYKADLSEEQRREGVEMLRQSGAGNPAVKYLREKLWGIPHLEKFAAIDVTDSEDPEFGAKIAAPQARHQQEHPEIAAEIAATASFTVPDGAGQPAG
jgi:hypothetical protein